MNKPLTPAEIALRDGARDYHNRPMPGKLSITPTKPLSNQRDLSLAYSPGVAYPCLDIQADPSRAAEYTSRANLVGVITNGTAVLGLGNIGPLAGKPVMEGKACLFKKFAGVDVFDIDRAAPDPDRLVDIIAALEPTLGGVNLEDIKAPECFYIEKRLRERMNIPVFHDDQHGTAIIMLAGLKNALKLVGKDLSAVRIVINGAGAAATAVAGLLMIAGASDLTLCDRSGAVWNGRTDHMNGAKRELASRTNPHLRRGTLSEVLTGADVFIGVSAPGMLTTEMVRSMNRDAVVFACANPVPEIFPDEAKAGGAAVVSTGRSDYPNQVNNVLCFPGIFRGALDVRASDINDAMKLAAADALAALVSEDELCADYILPKAFDPRVRDAVASAAALAARESGVSRI